MAKGMGMGKTGFKSSNMKPGPSTSGKRSTVSGPGTFAMKVTPNVNTGAKGAGKKK